MRAVSLVISRVAHGRQRQVIVRFIGRTYVAQAQRTNRMHKWLGRERCPSTRHPTIPQDLPEELRVSSPVLLFALREILILRQTNGYLSADGSVGAAPREGILGQFPLMLAV